MYEIEPAARGAGQLLPSERSALSMVVKMMPVMVAPAPKGVQVFPKARCSIDRRWLMDGIKRG